VDRVVFDTNVLVSATLSRGKPYTVLELAERGDIDSVTSPDIIDELEDVLSRERLPFESEQIDEVVGKIFSMSELVTPEMDLEAVEDDPDDDKVLECAVAGNADYIVSGDSHLLDIEEYRGVEIVSPDEFLSTRNS
jgi:putative PIN family toxin of toxin-antitoxin system